MPYIYNAKLTLIHCNTIEEFSMSVEKHCYYGKIKTFSSHKVDMDNFSAKRFHRMMTIVGQLQNCAVS